MNDKEEERRNWRANWLTSIEEFADGETQRRLWTAPPNPHFSYVEYMCCYFDDLGLSNGGYETALARGLVSPDEVEAVAIFHALADSYDSPTDVYDDKAVLADPKWAEVVAAAKQAQVVLLKLIDDELERRLLTEP